MVQEIREDESRIITHKIPDYLFDGIDPREMDRCIYSDCGYGYTISKSHMSNRYCDNNVQISNESAEADILHKMRTGYFETMYSGCTGDIMVMTRQ